MVYFFSTADTAYSGSPYGILANEQYRMAFTFTIAFPCYTTDAQGNRRMETKTMTTVWTPTLLISSESFPTPSVSIPTIVPQT